MSKTKTRFVCQQCGRVTLRMMGKCPQCGTFNSMVEEVVVEAAKPSSRRPSHLGHSTPRRLADIESGSEDRWQLPIEEFSRVLGGGIVPGSLVLVGGDPGIGKSTLLLSMALLVAETYGPVLYVSGEESERQIKMRAARLRGEPGNGAEPADSAFPEELYLVTETSLDAILAHIASVKPRLVIIDSIQTTYLGDLTSSAGSVSQIRECALRLQALAKTAGIAIFLIGHVTKEGTLAGPRVLEHIVDTVLQLEGDRYQAYRLLRATKNRFGATSEVGVFEMAGSGLLEVRNPSEAFLAERMVNTAGSAIAVTMEGTRPILVEIQGLTSLTAFGNPRRTPNGVDFNRLLLITAVLTKRLGLKLGEQDVFVNVIGGLKVGEPAADLAIATAMASSVLDRPTLADIALIGEIGLSGELRAVNQLPQRLREARQLGFRRVVAPRALRVVETKLDGLDVIQARSLRDALEAALQPADRQREAGRGREPGARPPQG
ncbi:MAG: DNA repair protein RadA [Anaerolineales bacterium]|nr:DNA repair protein RadA [Anaerolineales bacterium]